MNIITLACGIKLVLNFRLVHKLIINDKEKYIMLKKIEKKHILAQFEALVKHIEAGSEVVIMDNHNAIAKIVKLTAEERSQLKPTGTEKKWTADDFNLSLSDE
jgi:antitoxin (DNA-binding transcriptional repressor) of toxin-antitoxin stability system